MFWKFNHLRTFNWYKYLYVFEGYHLRFIYVAIIKSIHSIPQCFLRRNIPPNIYQFHFLLSTTYPFSFTLTFRFISFLVFYFILFILALFSDVIYVFIIIAFVVIVVVLVFFIYIFNYSTSFRFDMRQIILTFKQK